MMLTIGLSLSLIAIGVLFYLGYYQKNQIQKKCNKLETSLLSLQKEFTAYQLDQARNHNKSDTDSKIKFDRMSKLITKNEQLIYISEERIIKKEIPKAVKELVKHIELSKPLDNQFVK